MTRPTVLILGGFDKHSDFHELFEHFAGSRLKGIVVLGETKQKILDTAKDDGYLGFCHTTSRFEDAVNCARLLASPGDRCLLYARCASLDMFDNFEQRGDVFKELVNGSNNPRLENKTPCGRFLTVRQKSSWELLRTSSPYNRWFRRLESFVFDVDLADLLAESCVFLGCPAVTPAQQARPRRSRFR